MIRRTRIPKRDLVEATREEAKEHPWLTHKEAQKVAMDHLSKHPAYMKAMSVAEQIMAKEEARNKPKRRKPRPKADGWINSGFPY